MYAPQYNNYHSHFFNVIIMCNIPNVYCRFLATGESFTSLAFGFRMGESTVHDIVSEVN
jgi:hypothetical protein